MRNVTAEINGLGEYRFEIIREASPAIIKLIIDKKCSEISLVVLNKLIKTDSNQGQSNGWVK